MTDFERELLSLLSSPNYQKLATFESSFDPFEVIGIAERNYSNVLTWLLGNAENRQFRQAFVSHVADFRNIQISPTCDYSAEVCRELGDARSGQVDVFIRVHSLKLVAAIEVKIDAQEGHKQIARYQEFLARNYPGYSKVVVFLTKRGTFPNTAAAIDGVPVLNMSWNEVTEMISSCTGYSDQGNFRHQFRSHLQRKVLMEQGARDIVIDFLKEGNNANTVRKIIDNYPHLGESRYMDQYKDIVADIVGVEKAGLEVRKYGKRL